VDRHVAILELLSEKVLAAMEEKENEAKRARTVRYEYQRDVEHVQTWICQAEGRVQDRSLEPQTLKEFLQVNFFVPSYPISGTKFQNPPVLITSIGVAMRNRTYYGSNGASVASRPTHLPAYA